MGEREVAVPDEPFAGFSGATILGVGRHSTVYRAVENGTNRPVALKVIGGRDGVAALSPAALEAFARESAVLGALGSHPNIVTLYRTLQVPAGPVLVLELCRGSLAGRLLRGRVPVRDAVGIGVRIAGALATVHSAGVLHRNVSPANILITEFGEPALADFAIARLHYSDSRAGNPAAELLDFPGPHAAPEVLLGEQVDERTDVYGLASTLYHLIAGRPPFVEMGGEAVPATILRILRDPPQPLPEVALELSDLLLWGLAKERADRPPSAAWFAEELRRVETQQGWPRTALLVRETETVDPPGPRPSGRRPRPGPHRPTVGAARPRPSAPTLPTPAPPASAPAPAPSAPEDVLRPRPLPQARTPSPS